MKFLSAMRKILLGIDYIFIRLAALALQLRCNCFPTLSFILVTLALFAMGLRWGGLAPACYGLIFVWSLSFSLLNQQINCEKWEIIEGRGRQSEMKYLHFTESMSWALLIAVHLCLLLSLALVLQQIAALAGGKLFMPGNLGVWRWGLYALDMVLKALLFDIPEIYGIELIHIEHVGFWGSTVVFVARLVILILVLGSVLRLHRLRQWMWQTLSMLGHYPQIAQTRLLSLVKMYPRYLNRLGSICRGQKLEEDIRQCLIETLGKTGREEMVAMFDYFLRCGVLGDELAALRGLEYLQRGNLARVLSFLAEGKEEALKFQACKTLATWQDSQAIKALCGALREYPKREMRMAIISALGKNKRGEAVSALLNTVKDQSRDKEERFAAKDALVAIGEFSPQIEELTQLLSTSTQVDYRRFAAIILGGIPSPKSLPPLLLALPVEEDSDTRVHIARAIAAIAKSGGKRDFSVCDWSKTLAVLLDATEDPQPFVRVACLYAIDQLGWFIATVADSRDTVAKCLAQCKKASDLQTKDAAADVWEHLSPVLSEQYSISDERSPITACEFDDLHPLPSSLKTTLGAKVSEACSSPISVIPKRYQQQILLHRGKIADIYKVCDMIDGKDKALKVFSGESNWQKEMFLREIGIVKTLHHPNLVPVLEVYNDSELCFTMPYIEALPLSTEMQRRKNEGEPWNDSFLPLFEKLCLAVGYLHQNHILHLDLKPGNIFYAQQPLLFDFGIARCLPPLPGKLNLPPERGTPFYMAPEQYYGGEVNLQTDIYALAVIAYELLTCQLPLGICPKPPDRLSLAVLKILSYAGNPKREKRPPSVERFWLDLQRALLR